MPWFLYYYFTRPLVRRFYLFAPLFQGAPGDWIFLFKIYSNPRYSNYFSKDDKDNDITGYDDDENYDVDYDGFSKHCLKCCMTNIT